jgi:hypothetical protein
VNTFFVVSSIVWIFDKSIATEFAADDD